MRALISVLLVACVACDDGSAASDEVNAVLDLTGDATAGADVFAGSCGASTCHAADGSGGDGVDLREHVPEHSDEQLVELMIHGEGEMPATGLSAQETADVLAYLRETFGG
jgi:mono/diheme cytochrome c family protein